MNIGLFGISIVADARKLADAIGKLSRDDAAAVLNEVRTLLHEVSPFKAEPVDCVLWVPSDEVAAKEHSA